MNIIFLSEGECQEYCGEKNADVTKAQSYIYSVFSIEFAKVYGFAQCF